ncbi:hypothetical protein [Anaerolentibacter hominis]|uniref:hypothetical protein n=1 Tax=Anaerolentibacter hominis TaxID=3079009 RepID=UPI0031B805AE
MFKLFRYELRRLLWNKFFPALTLITIWYARQILTGEILMGISNTAPFSGWSFGVFLAQVSPLLLITLLFFLTFLYSEQEKEVRKLTDPVLLSPIKYHFVQYGAIAAGYLILCIIVLVEAGICYYKWFGFREFQTLILPALLVLVPSFLFLFGLGNILGRIKGSLLYALMLLMLVLTQLPMPVWFDLLGESYLREYPLSLGIVEPAFQLSLTAGISRLIFCLTGILFTALALRKKKEQ